MELRSLPNSISGIPSALTQIGLKGKPFVIGPVIKIPNFQRYPNATNLKFFGARAQASGSRVVEAIPKNANSKDDNLVFVAGATGKVGSRTVRELLKLGFKVRAGVRSAQRAESLLQSVQQMKLGGEVGSEGTKPIEKLEIVECDLENDPIVPALGNASAVICCIGASEKEVFDITGPYRIDYLATKNLVDAATVAKVNHFVLLTSLGTNKVGFPAAILNLFWGVLIWKRKAEEALLASGLPYTIVRPGGMERPTDAYKETHNISLSKEDTLFGGQVSNLQVAELMAFMAKNPSLSYCKVIEVIAETTAPLTPMEELLEKIPSQRVEVKVKPQKELDTAGMPPSAVTKTVVSEPSSTPVEKEEPVVPKAKAKMALSPYIIYDDLRPPTSPSPNAPSGSIPPPLSVLVNNIPQALPADKPVDEECHAVTKPRPLSPFTMYEDLKPPTSPSPTPRKL